MSVVSIHKHFSAPFLSLCWSLSFVPECINGFRFSFLFFLLLSLRSSTKMKSNSSESLFSNSVRYSTSLVHFFYIRFCPILFRLANNNREVDKRGKSSESKWIKLWQRLFWLWKWVQRETAQSLSRNNDNGFEAHSNFVAFWLLCQLSRFFVHRRDRQRNMLKSQMNRTLPLSEKHFTPRIFARRRNAFLSLYFHI